MLHIARLGPVELPDGEERFLYVPLGGEGGAPLQPILAADDATGLASFTHLPDPERTCDAELAEAGAVLGFLPAPTPAEAREVLASIALALAQAAFAPLQPRLVIALLAACGRLARGGTWKRLGGGQVLPVELRGAKPGKRELLLTGRTSLVLFDRRGAAARVEQGGEEAAAREASLSLELADAPAWALARFDEAFKLTRMPVAARRLPEGPAGLTALDVAVLVALLEALDGLGRAGVSAEAEVEADGLLVHCAVTLEGSLPAAPPPEPARKPAPAARKPPKPARTAAKPTRKPAVPARKAAKAARKVAKPARKAAAAPRKAPKPARSVAKSPRKAAPPVRKPATPSRKAAKPARSPARRRG